jgi:hypothetical protein
MRHLLFCSVLVLSMACPVVSRLPAVDPNSFHTSANFSVDGNAMSLSTAVATIEPRRGAPGYSWLRISFYSFPVAAEDLAAIGRGDTGTLDKKWNQKAIDPKDYNKSHAVIQLSVDQNSRVWQVDMSIPGHTCTIAPFEKDVTAFLQDYQFDGKNLKLKSKGSYVCDMKFMGVPNQTFNWDLDLHAAVYQKIN